VPVSQYALYSAAGWVDWSTPALYVTLRNNKSAVPDATVRADAAGLTVLGSLQVGTTTGTPSSAPLPDPPLHPSAAGWKRSIWASLTDAYGEQDLELLLNELIALSSPTLDKPAALAKYASRLRSDNVDGTPVTVFEIRQPSEAKVAPGQGRLRFWVDGQGLLRRLELRTRTGAYGYVTVTPGRVPTLPNPVPLKS
jgi:hypothetical protein